MIKDPSDHASNPHRARRSVIAVLLSGAAGSVTDWLIIFSQFSQRGNITPFVPPISLVMLAVGTLVCLPAVDLTSRGAPRPYSAGGLALLGGTILATVVYVCGVALSSGEIIYTMLWLTPIALIAITITTWIAARTGHLWSRVAVLTIGCVVLITTLLMWFLLPRV